MCCDTFLINSNSPVRDITRQIVMEIDVTCLDSILQSRDVGIKTLVMLDEQGGKMYIWGIKGSLEHLNKTVIRI